MLRVMKTNDVKYRTDCPKGGPKNYSKDVGSKNEKKAANSVPGHANNAGVDYC